jgi:hypothetical protein
VEAFALLIFYSSLKRNQLCDIPNRNRLNVRPSINDDPLGSAAVTVF